MQNNKILYGIIAILVLVIAGFLVNLWYTQKIVEAQQQGYQVGITQSVAAIIQQSRNCQVVPLFIGNQTFQFVDTACLKVQTNKTE